MGALRVSPAFLTAYCTFVAATGTAFGEPLTLDDLVEPQRLTGAPPRAPAWSPDGQQLAFLWHMRPDTPTALWLVDRDGKNRRTVFTAANNTVTDFAWWPDGHSLLATSGDDLWRIDVSTGTQQRLTRDGVPKTHLAIAPDGKTIAFIQDGDLFTVKATGGRAYRRTRIAKPSISNVGLGTYDRRDREIGSSTWSTGTPVVAWSPDSRYIAIHVVERQHLRRVAFPYYLDAETNPNELRRPYPGDVNEVRRIYLINARSNQRSIVHLARSNAMQIVNLTWSPRGELLIDRMSDDNTVREIHVAAPNQRPTQLWRDERKTRIYTGGASAWSLDGRAVYVTADLDDRYRVYRTVPGRAAREAVTPATYDTLGPAVPLGDDRIAFTAQAPSPAERHVYVTTGSKTRRITHRPGTHRAVIAPDGRTVASVFSDDITPPELWLIPMDQSVPVRVTEAGTPRLRSAGLIAPSYVRFPGADAGDILRAKIWRPDRDKAPVVFGPIYVNTVRNRWDGRFGLLQQMLVQRGYAVIQVDVRGSTGYGRTFREKFLFTWGQRDLDDLAAAKRWLATQAWADVDRLGVFGSSYGGTVGIYAMLTRPGLFDVAVAAAPATDPRFFGSDDVAITRRPDTHPAPFKRGAAQFADGLAGHLMIIHGLMDDVVPFKTTAVLTEALMRAKRDFDLVIAPGATHRWSAQPHHARFLLSKLLGYFERHLPPNDR